MDNLFSHARTSHGCPVQPGSPAQPGPPELDPVVYTVMVPGAVARAFVGFTEHTHLWWPLEDHSVLRRRLLRGVRGEPDPGDRGRRQDGHLGVHRRLAAPAVLPCQLAPRNHRPVVHGAARGVRAVEGGTELRLVHSGWEGAEDPAATRAEYAAGWPRSWTASCASWAAAGARSTAAASGLVAGGTAVLVPDDKAPWGTPGQWRRRSGWRAASVSDVPAPASSSCQQAPDGQRALAAGVLVDRGQPEDLAEFVAVDADHGQVVRHPEPEVAGGEDGADRHLIGRREDRCGPFGACRAAAALA